MAFEKALTCILAASIKAQNIYVSNYAPVVSPTPEPSTLTIAARVIILVFIVCSTLN